MAIETLKHRLETVEIRLEMLQHLFEERIKQDSTPSTNGEATQKEKRGWRAIVGTFENDPLYDEAMQKGREWRESQCEETD
jgi:hypothetical protein